MSVQKDAQNILANLDFIRAAAEGKTIEKNIGGSWFPVLEGWFRDPHKAYRIKREPIAVFWVMAGDTHITTFPDRERAEEWAARNNPKYRVVELREVVKE